MKQVLQNLRSGVTEVADIPAPALRPGHLVIRTSRTLVSTGTEKTLVEFAKAGWLEKIRQQPEKMKTVFDKIRSDGVIPTMEAVFSAIDKPIPLGYCNAGVALEIGAGVSAFSAGDRVVSNGKHAEVVAVPTNLCARVPDNVSDDEAAFAIIGAIALQGIRLAQPTLGESVVVTGLGLVGLVTVQLLRANGCRVLGIDYDAKKLELARQFGAETVDLSAGEDPVVAAAAFSRGRGVDAVLITAATTSNEPMHQAAQMSRKRGRIVLVGVTGLELSRADFYEKELSFQVSCSYGPGRYDPSYEEKGFDYPVGFVRWTEQRNIEAVLDMMADGKLNVTPLVSHRFSIEAAPKAYDLIGSSEPSLGVLLEYTAREVKSDEQLLRRHTDIPASALRASAATRKGKQPRIAFIGAGNYATSVLIGAFKDAGAELHTAVSSNGLTGAYAGRKFGFAHASTDTDSVMSDANIDAVVIATRHDSHPSLAVQAIEAGKHVFVEKPLAVTTEQLAQIENAIDSSPIAGEKILTVGFNRRFAPHVRHMAALLDGVSEPKVFVMTVNAGAIPPGHWVQDAAVGGGRIIGEACHFIDLLRFLARSPISGFDAVSLGKSDGNPVAEDKSSITLRFEDGSIGTIHYLANGHKSFPKERLEVFCAGRILQLDNFRSLNAFGWPNFNRMHLWRQDKGQKACAAAFVKAVSSGGPAPIPLNDLFEVSRVSIEVADALR